MRKTILLSVMAILIAFTKAGAQIFPVYSYASQIMEFPMQPFSDVKYMDIPSDERPYIFDNQNYEYDEDLSTSDMFVMRSTSSDEILAIDTREIFGPDVLAVVYSVGEVAYYYVDNAEIAARLRNELQNQHNEYQEVIIDSADGIDSGSGTSSGGSHYLATYRRWERQAENAYDSLTHASVSSSTYIRNKKLLRDAQNEMRKVRRQAVRAGITIDKSDWEDARVHLE